MIARAGVALVALLSCAAIAEVTVIDGATVHTMGPDGTLVNARIVVRDDIILSVGPLAGDVPNDATRIDAAGMIVTPGLFASAVQLGLVEVDTVPDTVDFNQSGTRFAASFDIASAYNPRSTLIAVNRTEGVTHAVVTPSSSPGAVAGGSHVLSGLGALVHLGEVHLGEVHLGEVHLGAPTDAISKRGIVMVANLGEAGAGLAGGSRAAALMTLRSAFTDAIHYRDHRSDHDRGNTRTYSMSAADLAALDDVLTGKIPLIVAVNRASDITASIALAREFGFRLIILGGAEAWMVAGELASADASVILDGFNNLPSSFDHVNATLESAAILYQAGVTLTFGAGTGTHKAANITQGAGMAVAFGLPPIAALEAVTINPARMFGVEAELGSLEVGKIANLVIWPADPLELTTFPHAVFIQGEQVSMVSRQTLLRDRYLTLIRARL